MKVIFYRAVNKGTIKANFNLLLPSGMIIYKMTWMLMHDGREFLNMPSEKVTNALGITKYYPIVSFETTELRDIFQQKCKVALSEYLNNNPDCQNPVSKEKKYENKDANEW